MHTERFYRNLPAIENFIEVTNDYNFVPLPHDWYIVVTDIVGSTKAIAEGRYKDINLIGACSIIAILNVANKIEIPFVFGGDGASLGIPPTLLVSTKRALLATQRLAKNEFKLDLRIGVIPVLDITVRGYDIKVAKLKVSQNYNQAMFIGGGLSYATEVIKDTRNNQSYQIRDTTLKPKADFSGLECRWQDIPSQHGETVSLIVRTTPESRKQMNQIYREVIEKIQEFYGGDNNFHPILHKNLNLTFDVRNLYLETKVRAKSRSRLHKLLYLAQIQLENFFGFLLMKLKIKLKETDWGAYKNIVITATDYRKFDDMLHMVIAGNALQRRRLTHYLERKYQEGKLVYGLHVANRALLTCLILERSGRQVHFIDGADGGYALAAKEFKAKIDKLKPIDC